MNEIALRMVPSGIPEIRISAMAVGSATRTTAVSRLDPVDTRASTRPTPACMPLTHTAWSDIMCTEVPQPLGWHTATASSSATHVTSTRRPKRARKDVESPRRMCCCSPGRICNGMSKLQLSKQAVGSPHAAISAIEAAAAQTSR